MTLANVYPTVTYCLCFPLCGCCANQSLESQENIYSRLLADIKSLSGRGQVCTLVELLELELELQKGAATVHGCIGKGEVYALLSAGEIATALQTLLSGICRVIKGEFSEAKVLCTRSL